MKRQNLVPDIKPVFLGAAGASGTSDVTSDPLAVNGFRAVVFMVRVATAAADNVLSVAESDDGGTTYHELDADFAPTENGQYAMVEIKPTPGARLLRGTLKRGTATAHGEFIGVMHAPRSGLSGNGSIVSSPTRKP